MQVISLARRAPNSKTRPPIYPAGAQGHFVLSDLGAGSDGLRARRLPPTADYREQTQKMKEPVPGS